MNLYLAVQRVVHIFSGVFWVGTIFYFALFFLPRIKTLGPDRADLHAVRDVGGPLPLR